MKKILSFIKEKCFTKKNIEHSEEYYRRIAFLNKYLYNAFLVFASFTLVYLFKRRAFVRVILTGFWTVLGIINGCILSNRVTPFGYTDLKCIPELFAMNNTNYFTAEQATIVVFGLAAFIFFCTVLFIKGPRYQGKRRPIVVPIAIAAVLFAV